MNFESQKVGITGGFDFEMAILSFSQVSDSLSNRKATLNRKKLVSVYVVESSG